MRLLLLIAVIACLPGSSVSQQRKNDSANPAQAVQPSPPAQQNPSQTTIVNVEPQQPTAQAQVAKHDHHKSRWPEIFSAWGTVSIAGLTFVYVFVTALMLSQLKKDVAVAQTAANAAEITAKAAINAERAWMCPRIEKLSQFEQYELRVVNDGKTPGRIVEYSVEAFEADLSQTPIKETGSHRPIRTNKWVNSGEDRLIETFDRMRKMWELPAVANKPGGVKDFIDGYVEYVTAVEIDIKPPKIHRTTFRYEWDYSANELIPKPDYWTYS